jgi:hypothetical protein
MYLVHHPLTGAVQILLAPTALPALAKAILSWSAVTGVTLLTFELFVRKTRLNGWLGGAMKRAVSPEETPETVPPEQSQAA